MTRLTAALAALLLGAGPALAQDPPAPPPPPSPETTFGETDWRAVPPANLLVIDTTRGRILVELLPEVAPQHVERIRLLARDEAPDTANSQFFIMRHAYPALDKRYTIWGMTVHGLEVVRALQVGDGDNGMMAQATPDRMTRMRIAADLPETERPAVQVLSTGSARFRALVEAARAARGADFSICDVGLPVQTAG